MTRSSVQIDLIGMYAGTASCRNDTIDVTHAGSNTKFDQNLKLNK